MENETVNPLNRFYQIVILGAFLIVCIGCGSTASSRLYTLTSLVSSGEAMPVLRDAFGLSIAVGPVQLPKYLQRPQIITLISPNKIASADFDRWAEPLEDNVSRVLVENLTLLLWDDHIAVFPWLGSSGFDYRIAVNVNRFDGQLGGTVFLITDWMIFDKDNNNILLQKRSVIKAASGQPDYESLVLAKSRILTDLSREIAEEIRSLK